MSDNERKAELLLNKARQEKANNRTVNIEDKKEKVVIFSLEEKKFAFYGSQVKEILKYDGANWVPGLPAYLLGLINLRGDIESVLDIAFLFNLPIAEDQRSHIFITETYEFRSGVVVDSIHDVVDIPVSSFQEPINTLDQNQKDLVLYEFDYGKERISLLRLEKIFEHVSF